MSGIIAAAGISAAAGLGSGLMQMGKGSGGTQTQTQQNLLPGWITDQSMQNYGDLTQASYNMPGPYTGQRVADLTPQQLQLIQQLYGNVGATNAGFQNALAGTNALMGFQGQTVTPQTLAGTNLNPYMNPYTQAVIDPSMRLLEQQRQQGLNQIASQAAQTRAFGGSRQGIAEAATNAQSNLLAGQLGANLWGQNFQQAQAAATGDITRNLQAQQYNQAAAQNAAALRGQMARQYGDLTGMQQTNYLAGINAAMGGQQMLTEQQQAQLNAQKALYEEQRMDPINRILLRQNFLNTTPYSRTSISTAPGPSTDPLSTGLGTSATMLGMFGTLGKMGLFGSGGARSVTGGTGPYDLSDWEAAGLSDRRLKTDIRKVGRDPATDLPMYAYRYKGDPKAYPKVVGPMAQDIQKKFPDQVATVGGYLAVNRNFLSGVMQRAT
jgi:hypothetical protein